MRLTLAEGVPLAHTLVDRVATDHGIRTLLIKGPILELQGLREPRQSGDVDVLCEPARIKDFTAALRKLGWEIFNEEPVTPRVLPPHADAYFHERWPCGIDVHHAFPGFFKPADAVFDVLWSRRATIEVAARSVVCTDTLASAAIHALHLLRGPELTRTQSDLDHLVEALRRLDAAGLRELAELADATGSADTLAQVLDRLGAPHIGRGQISPVDRAGWELRTTAGRTEGLIWIEELIRHPVYRWPQVLWRALTFDERRLYSTDPASERSLLEILRLVMRRSWKGLRRAPQALRALLGLRRG